MGEQRPMFRFRLPWMISSAPAPPPPVATQSPPRAEAPSTTSQPQTKIEPNVNPTLPARRPFRLSGIAPAPPPPIQPIVESQSKIESITITSTPKNLPQASPIWSPKLSTTRDPHPQAEVPPETKSQSENSFQPASPSRTHSPPTQLPSPSPPSPQLRATSQLPSPKLSVISRPPSPRKLPSQLPSPQLNVISRPPSPQQLPFQLPSPKSAPQPSSPRPTSSKARDASRPSSPDRAQFQKSSQGETFQQPHSPPQFQSSDQKSPITSSPSLTATDVQQTKRTETQSPPHAETPLSTFQPQTNIEPNVNPMTPVQKPFRLPGITPAKPPPSIQPTVQPQSQREPITITSGPTFPPQAPPLWSPKTLAPIDPLPQPEVSLESKSQSQYSSKPGSPFKTHSQATSQHPSPSSTSAQSSTAPEPPSPWRMRSQERDTTQLPSSKSSPQPSSPWRESSKERDRSQPSSPDRHQFQKSSQAETVQQPRSPFQLDFQPPKKTSPITSSPSLTATDIQQTERTSTRLPSPSMMSTNIKIPQPPASSDKPLSPVSVKPSVAVSQSQSLEDQSERKITPSVTFKSPTKATVQPIDSAAKPPKRDIEMVQNTSLMAQEEPKERTRAVHYTETSGFAPHNKEKLKIASQAEQEQLKDQEMAYEKEAKIPKASSLYEKQTNTMTSQQTDTKSTVSESRKKPVISNKDQIPFQKQLRNDISMFAQKMAMAHIENSKDEELASVVALVGKNKGAFMKLGSESAKGERSFKIYGANKTEPVEGTKENERNESAKRKRSYNEIDQENQVTKAFINNNVQDINNSILMNSSITERNPGVLLALYYDPTVPITSYDRKGSSEARKGKSRLPLPKAYI